MGLIWGFVGIYMGYKNMGNYMGTNGDRDFYGDFNMGFSRFIGIGWDRMGLGFGIIPFPASPLGIFVIHGARFEAAFVLNEMVN